MADYSGAQRVENVTAEAGGGRTVPAMTKPVADFDAHNTKLFRRRNAIRTEIEELEAKPRRGHRQESQLRRLRWELDEVTTEIFRFNRGLALTYARRFTSHSSREDSEDFRAAAEEGLMKAIDTFDPDRGRFGAWAYKPIQRKVLRAVRDTDFQTMTSGDFERRPEILAALARLRTAEGDEHYMPSYEEIAAEADVKVEQVRRILDAPYLDSIHQRVGEDGDTELGELIESGEASVENTVLSSMVLSALESCLSVLEVRELLVIVRRYGLDTEPPMILASIGEMLGLSREAVRQVENKAKAKIQHPVVLRHLAKAGQN